MTRNTRTLWLVLAAVVATASAACRAQNIATGPGSDLSIAPGVRLSAVGPLNQNDPMDRGPWAPGGIFAPPEGSGTYGLSTLSELQRLFGLPPGEDDFSPKQLGIKALLALPLMRGNNVLQLMLRPPGDIYGTYAKRFALRRLSELSHIDVPSGCVAVDLHVHTCYSHDSFADPAEMLRSAASRGLTGVAITDHDTMEGARKAREIADRWVREGKLPATFFVIPGEEITSTEGHIIALFLQHEVPAGHSAAETVRMIHDQGGLAIAAHPELTDGLGTLANTLPFDAVETQNAAEEMQFAAARHGAADRRAAFYKTVTKPRLGVSDAHDPGAVAVSYTLLDDCPPTPDGVRAAILAGNTTPVQRMPDDEERRQIRKGMPRVINTLNVLFGSDQSGMSLWLRRATHADSARLSLFPRPGIYWSKSF